MNSPVVLVLSKLPRKALVDELMNTGYTPLVRAHIADALDVLRHEKVRGIFVDVAHIEVDVLELVLNLHDVDPSVPVLVEAALVRRLEGSSALLNMRNVRLMERTGSVGELVQQLADMVGPEPDRSEPREIGA